MTQGEKRLEGSAVCVTAERSARLFPKELLQYPEPLEIGSAQEAGEGVANRSEIVRIFLV